MIDPDKAFLAEQSFDESLEETWTRLDQARSNHLGQMRDIAALVDPSLCPPAGASPDDICHGNLSTSLPGTMAMNLANVFVTTMFPDTIPFVLLELTEKGVLDAQSRVASPDDSPEAISAKLDEAKAFAEDLLLKEWAKWMQQSAFGMLALHAVVLGQGIGLIDDHTEEVTVVPPVNYAMERMADGTIKTIIFCEPCQIFELDDNVQEQVWLDRGAKLEPTDWVKVYTRFMVVERKGNGWRWEKSVSVDGMPVKLKGKTTFSADDLPIIDFPCLLYPGANYGTGPCMKNIGDIQQLAALTASVNMAAAQMSTIRWAISPGAGITPEAFAMMKNGDALRFDGSGVVPISGGDYRTISQVSQERDVLMRNLSAVFLYRPGVIRDSERTTAFEIRETINALHEAGHGMSYAQITKRVQPVVANYLMRRSGLGRDDTLDISVTGGSPALSRRGDAMRFAEFVQALSQAQAMPEPAQMMIDWKAMIPMVASWFAIDSRRFVGDAPPPQLQPPEGEMQA